MNNNVWETTIVVRIAGENFNKLNCNSILQEGEFFYHKSENNLYIGDGETSVKDLVPIFGPESSFIKDLNNLENKLLGKDSDGADKVTIRGNRAFLEKLQEAVSKNTSSIQEEAEERKKADDDQSNSINEIEESLNDLKSNVEKTTNDVRTAMNTLEKETTQRAAKDTELQNAFDNLIGHGTKAPSPTADANYKIYVQHD